MRNRLGILVVDEDDINIEIVRGCLQKKDLALPLFHVKTVSEALDYLRLSDNAEEAPTTMVALVDANTPTRSGVKLLQEIKLDASLKNTISFLISATPTQEEQRIAHKYGAIGYFLKTEIPEIIEILNDILQE